MYVSASALMTAILAVHATNTKGKASWPNVSFAKHCPNTKLFLRLIELHSMNQKTLMARGQAMFVLNNLDTLWLKGERSLWKSI